ncbi:hypothetical protein HPB51_015649 [Rhipicephalus microplus]|uniref:Uncharacterized protein n=1 Tax=Rhipicephalus microplus TaxID=6941 RepID=A0A9J6DAD6_RHIMP|nr:hypothetical protein HPB51_015649 [Rhipicephalus microplus]
MDYAVEQVRVSARSFRSRLPRAAKVLLSSLAIDASPSALTGGCSRRAPSAHQAASAQTKCARCAYQWAALGMLNIRSGRRAVSSDSRPGVDARNPVAPRCLASRVAYPPEQACFLSPETAYGPTGAATSSSRLLSPSAMKFLHKTTDTARLLYAVQQEIIRILIVADHLSAFPRGRGRL